MSLLDASHLWALRRARAAIHASLSGRDKTLPQMAERRTLALPGASGPLEGRLYRPAGVAVGAPLLLFFHGGGFVVSDLDTHEALCIRLAHAGGMRVLAASYRLAPEDRFPAQVDDALAVARWVVGGAHTLGGAAPIVLGGDSAGGYLAASVAGLLHVEAPGAVQAQLLLYPLLQLDATSWASGLLKEARALGWAAIRYINTQLLSAGASAPSLLDVAKLAPLPTVIAVGGVLDPCKADALVLAEMLRTAGCQVTWRDYPALIHGFGNLTHISEGARRALAEVGALVGELARR